MATRIAVALSTVPTAEVADEIARALVREGLAACVNVVPQIRSVYMWEGELCDVPELLLVIKTRADRIDAVRGRLVELHPYDVPELVVLDVTGGHAPYLSWVESSSL